MCGAIEIERMELEIKALKSEIARKDMALQKCKRDLRNRQGFDLAALRKAIDDALAPNTDFNLTQPAASQVKS